MSNTPGSSATASSSSSSSLVVHLRSPNVPDLPETLSVAENGTIASLKALVWPAADGAALRVIFHGRLLEDTDSLSDLLLPLPESDRVLHLVLRPEAAARTEAIARASQSPPQPRSLLPSPPAQPTSPLSLPNFRTHSVFAPFGQPLTMGSPVPDTRARTQESSIPYLPDRGEEPVSPAIATKRMRAYRLADQMALESCQSRDGLAVCHEFGIGAGLYPSLPPLTAWPERDTLPVGIPRYHEITLNGAPYFVAVPGSYIPREYLIPRNPPLPTFPMAHQAAAAAAAASFSALHPNMTPQAAPQSPARAPRQPDLAGPAPAPAPINPQNANPNPAAAQVAEPGDINFGYLVKLIFITIIFSQGGSWGRILFMQVTAIILYLYHIGRIRIVNFNGMNQAAHQAAEAAAPAAPAENGGTPTQTSPDPVPVWRQALSVFFTSLIPGGGDGYDPAVAAAIAEDDAAAAEGMNDDAFM